MQFLGLGKTKFNSSICLIDNLNINPTVEIFLTERLLKKKCSGAWPSQSLKEIYPRLRFDQLQIAENRDVIFPSDFEDKINQEFPFYEYLKKNNLDFFTKKFNANIDYLSHHLAHAYAALALSPFEESFIIVKDGAGTQLPNGQFEECSVFIQKNEKLECIFQNYICFSYSKLINQTFGNQIGACYEKISEYIFNSPTSSGKVMGLAPFGKSEKTEITNDLIIFQNSLDWNNAFHHKSKQEWEKSNNKNFQNLAATVQAKLENEYETLIANLKIKYPKIKNLILTGGCALNCTNNAKILKNKYFEKIYIPPFPGDECIGFGLAKAKEFNTHPNKWQPVPYENQSPYWGPLNSIPTSSKIESTFEKTKYLIKKHEDIAETASQLLYDGHIIAWFQGRSESGPRALGNRSILARPDKIGLKNFLNQEIKFRENFRPYGSSVLVEYASLYFQVKPGFENPFMSFAVGVNPQFHDLLKEVTHVDGTSRMQTVRSTQNNLFYKLINAFGNKSQLYCLLNTSLNIMDQPILETVEDAKNFMDNSKVKYLAIGDYLITNPEIDQ